MRHPPTPKQRTYRGRIRADMRSALNHLNRLYNWNVFYRSKPLAYYPNQLIDAADSTQLLNMTILIENWLASLGAIPSR